MHDLDNYRPIDLLTTIYKIWAEIMANRLNPALNIIAQGAKCAYKKKRPTRDNTCRMGNRPLQTNNNGYILHDISKASGAINRPGLRMVLYGNGSPPPIELIYMIKIDFQQNFMRLMLEFGHFQCKVFCRV